MTFNMQQFLKLNLKKEFSWVKWTKEDFEKLPEKLVAQKQSILDQIKKTPKELRTFENTVGALERSDEPISDAFAHLEILLSAHPNKDIRDTCAHTTTQLSNLTTDMVFDEGIYNAILEYVHFGKAPQKESHKKLLKETLDAYRRLGFGLPKVKRTKVQKLFKTLHAASQDFERNINEWQGSISVSKEELAGTPLSYQESLAQKDGKYIVTTDYPSINPFLTFSKSEEKRKELWTLAQQKGGKQNLVVLKRMLALRKQIASLLNYKSWAHYQLEEYLVKTPENTRTIMTQVLAGTKKLKDADLKKLSALKKQDSKKPLSPWDMAYYDNLLRQTKYHIDENELREHLPLTHVIQTMFSIFENLLSISFKKTNTLPTWYEDVFRYEVRDVKTKETIGHLLLDLYPREGKYGHAAAFPTSDARKDIETGLQKPTAITLMCNFAKPGKGSVSLLSRYDTEAFFHEFGHALHSLLCRVEYASQSSAHTKLDFIESPSQLLEHWCWNPKILATLTKHYKTGKPLSKQKIAALVKSQYHLEGYTWTSIITKAIFALDIHEKNIPDLQSHFRSLSKKHLDIDYPKDSLFPAGFSHLTNYAAAYYVYLFSKIYCDDFTSVFKTNGITNKSIGMRYRKEILEPGASRNEDESVKAFLGRPINSKTFLKEIRGGN